MAALSNPKDSIVTKPPGRNLLESLPPELQLRIFEYTAYGDAFKLVQLNKHFNGLVKPQKWPAKDKAKFVQKAQLFPQHNRMHMVMEHMDDNGLVWDMNGFACYSCYRVLPQGFFSTNQCTFKNSKHSTQDRHSDTGCGRFCIPCGLESGKYRVGTLVGVITDMRIHKYLPSFTYQSFHLTFCAGHNGFAHSSESLNHTTWCPDCEMWTKTRSDQNHRYEFVESTEEYMRFFECPQCGDLTLACDDEKRRCCYCKRDICHSCGCTANKAGDWWCGLACSKAGWEFIQATITDAWPLKLTLKNKINEKHVERNPEKKKMTDLLGCEDVEEALSWLSL
ncbi:hypothetical protein LTR17_007093 [Elasticomyces elasticus]|nr:hypothetical protein LTR17_007093 [Elasticomyces elasticus]